MLKAKFQQRKEKLSQALSEDFRQVNKWGEANFRRIALPLLFKLLGIAGMLIQIGSYISIRIALIITWVLSISLTKILQRYKKVHLQFETLRLGTIARFLHWFSFDFHVIAEGLNIKIRIPYENDSRNQGKAQL